MAEDLKYECNKCYRRFDDDEFNITKDEHKCILHCEKEKEGEIIEKGYEDIKKYGNLTNNFSKHIEELVLEHKKSDDYKEGYFLELKNIIYPLHNFGHFENIKVHFENCKFLNDIVLRSDDSEFIQFFECDFFGQFKTSGKLVGYNQELIIRECNFYWNVNISNTKYNKIVDLRETTFHKELNFDDTTFKDNIFFNNCEFYEELNLENAFFYKEKSFLGIKTINGVKNRETARKIKDSFEQQNNIIEANKYYALEMKEREKELSNDIKKGKNFFDWLVFKIHGITSNHSQDWLLALFWIISLSYGSLLLENSNDSLIPIFVFIVLGICISSFDSKLHRATLIILLGILNSGVYLILSNDFSLHNFANKLNPISYKDMSFSMLVYKAIIAYLIYQFIISIRQNTRRK